MSWETKTISRQPDGVAPDGSEVYLGLECSRGGLAVFVLPAGRVSRAVRHRTIEEVWFFMDGEGEMWRRSGESEELCRVIEKYAARYESTCLPSVSSTARMEARVSSFSRAGDIFNRRRARQARGQASRAGQ